MQRQLSLSVAFTSTPKLPAIISGKPWTTGSRAIKRPVSARHS